jgi:hypothetical protein
MYYGYRATFADVAPIFFWVGATRNLLGQSKMATRRGGRSLRRSSQNSTTSGS